MSSARQAKRARQREARQRRKERKPQGGRSAAPTPLVLADDVVRAGALGMRPSTLLSLPAARRRPLVQLDDGSIGFCMDPMRFDDCFRAALATVTQIPVEQVPDPRLDERLAAGESPDEINRKSRERLDSWLAGRGLRLVFHHDALPVDRDRWIGVVLASDPDPDLFDDHSIILARDRIIFNPSISLPVPEGWQVQRPTLSDIAYGITVDNTEEQ